jgi:hypothetical protein
MDDPILELLGRARTCPAMYIGKHSAEHLFLYLVGYRQAIQERTELDTSRFSRFIESLYEKYGAGGGGHSWAWVLSHKAGGDPEGLDLFFAELDLFLQTEL